MLQNVSIKNEIMIYEDIISALIESIASTFFFLLRNYKSERNQIKMRENTRKNTHAYTQYIYTFTCVMRAHSHADTVPTLVVSRALLIRDYRERAII